MSELKVEVELWIVLLKTIAKLHIKILYKNVYEIFRIDIYKYQASKFFGSIQRLVFYRIEIGLLQDISESDPKIWELILKNPNKIPNVSKSYQNSYKFSKNS